MLFQPSPRQPIVTSVYFLKLVPLNSGTLGASVCGHSCKPAMRGYSPTHVHGILYVGGKDGKTVCSHEETAPILELDMRNQEDHNPDSLVDCPFAVVKCG